MSSSGEEVDIEQEKAFHWTNETTKKLVRYVQSRLTPSDDISPYNTVSINWDDVEEVVGVEEKKCEHKWNLLLASVRTYRTMPEILTDILTQTARDEISKHNKVQQVKQKSQAQQTKSGLVNSAKKPKKKVNPDHPARPRVNGYSIFCNEMIKDLSQTDSLKGVGLMLKMGAKWKELSEEAKAAYSAKCLKQKEEYLPKLQQYAQKHPEDIEIQEILHKELAKAKGSKSSKKMFKEEELKEEITDLTMNSMDDTVSSAESNSILLSPKKSPKKKRRGEDSELSQDSTPSKKKKKKKVWTGEEIYVESKFESYKEDHSDLEDDKIRSKLTRKYNKMTEEKKAKYKTKAEERNS